MNAELYCEKIAKCGMFLVPVAVSVKSTGLTEKGLVLSRKLMKHVIRHRDA